MRGYEHEIEKTYVQAISNVFSKDDPITAMKKREVYHHLKDAGRNMSITVDVAAPDHRRTDLRYRRRPETASDSYCA